MIRPNSLLKIYVAEKATGKVRRHRALLSPVPLLKRSQCEIPASPFSASLLVLGVIQKIHIQTRKLGHSDNGNANLLLEMVASDLVLLTTLRT